MKIKKISYTLTNSMKYFVETEKRCITLEFDDALEIAYAVIDSLNGDYEYLDDIVEKLKNIDVNTLTPIEAMNFVFELKKLISTDPGR